MKKVIIAFIIAIISQLSFTSVQAQSPTSSASITPHPTVAKAQSLEDKLIENFKEKVATKVAELRKKNDKPVVGRVSAIKDTNITVQTKEGDFTAKVDENLTKIFDLVNGAKSEIKLKDLKKGDYIIVSGPQLDKVVTANTIFRDEEYLIKSGKITEVNTTSDYFKILSSEKDVITLDISIKTRMQILNSKTLDIEAVTMAKIKEGDTIHFAYKKTGTEKEVNRFAAERVLIIPQEYFQK